MEMVKKFEPVALFLMIIGALNWAVVALFDTNVITEVFGTGTVTDVIYVLVRRLRPGLGAAADGGAPSRPRAAPARRLTPKRERQASAGRAFGPGPRRITVRAMTVHTSEIRLSTRGDADVVDITGELAAAVAAQRRRPRARRAPSSAARPRRSRRWSSSPAASTTCSALLDRLIPAAGDYEHNRLNHDSNSHAHQRASIVGASEVVPVVGGRPALGHLAAARPDRLRRPPARAHGRPSGDRLRLASPSALADARRPTGRSRARGAGAAHPSAASASIAAGPARRPRRRRRRRRSRARPRSRARGSPGAASAAAGRARAASSWRPSPASVVGAVGERVGVVEVEQPPQLGQRLRRVLDPQLDLRSPTPRRRAGTTSSAADWRPRTSPPASSAASSAASSRRASGPVGRLERRGHRRPDGRSRTSCSPGR